MDEEKTNGPLSAFSSLSTTIRYLIIALTLVALVVGYLIGNANTRFINGGPANLIDWQLDNYVRGLAASYERTQDAQYTLRAVCLGQEQPDADLNRIEQRASAADVAAEPATAAAYASVQNAVTTGGGCEAYREANAEAIQRSGGLGTLGNVLVGVLLLIVLALGGYLLWQRTRSQTDEAEPTPSEPDEARPVTTPTPDRISESRRREVTPAPPPPVPAERPTVPDNMPQHLGGFTMTYSRGDADFDKSFVIETGAGEFLGECGVTVSETIGRDDAATNATAFELWLFDKNDARTVTKVIMSEHAFGDDAMRAKLAPRGEPVEALADEVLALETASLIINATISEVLYADEDPTGGVFQRMTLDLAAWVKSETERQGSV